MKRREFVERLGFGSVVAASLPVVANSQGHQHAPLSGPLSNATVSFGQWPTDPPFDRYPNVPPAPSQNVHLLTPNMPSIKAGGAVNFVIAGLHNVQIFEPGKQPGEEKK